MFRKLASPFLLVVLCPPLTGLVWFTSTKLDGSVMKLGELMISNGIISTIYQACRPVFFGSVAAWTIIAIFAGIELALMRLVPGPRWEGPTTPAGYVPVYKANGVASFGITIVIFVVCSFGFGFFPATIIYDHFGEILGALNVSSIALCALLYLKGLYLPSGPDHGSNGNPILDFYWGTELYPLILGWNVKQFITCRFGMMSWSLILLSFMAKQYEKYGLLSDSMIVAVTLQLVYVAKFFWWETGYLRSLDIMHDRAGFYICWGCMVWLPAIYTSSTLYLVDHANHLGTSISTVIIAVGLAAILITYLADAQRKEVRMSGGKSKVWGRSPALISARYIGTNGERKTNLLLASGWWGISRHFHYVPEVLGSLCWTVPALFDHVLPYFYVIFLTVLLIDRAARDDRRCAAKYGADWRVYCLKVPYKVIPGII